MVGPECGGRIDKLPVPECCTRGAGGALRLRRSPSPTGCARRQRVSSAPNACTNRPRCSAAPGAGAVRLGRVRAAFTGCAVWLHSSGAWDLASMAGPGHCERAKELSVPRLGAGGAEGAASTASCCKNGNSFLKALSPSSSLEIRESFLKHRSSSCVHHKSRA
jgi:hypothetical protein